MVLTIEDDDDDDDDDKLAWNKDQEIEKNVSADLCLGIVVTKKGVDLFSLNDTQHFNCFVFLLLPSYISLPLPVAAC